MLYTESVKKNSPQLLSCKILETSSISMIFAPCSFELESSTLFNFYLAIFILREAMDVWKKAKRRVFSSTDSFKKWAPPSYLFNSLKTISSNDFYTKLSSRRTKCDVKISWCYLYFSGNEWCLKIGDLAENCPFLAFSIFLQNWKWFFETENIGYRNHLPIIQRLHLPNFKFLCHLVWPTESY